VSALSSSDRCYTQASSKVCEPQALHIPQEEDFTAGIGQRTERVPSEGGIEVCKGLLFRSHVGCRDILGCVRADEPSATLLSQLIPPQISDAS
jgi:hypothetical protein